MANVEIYLGDQRRANFATCLPQLNLCNYFPYWMSTVDIFIFIMVSLSSMLLITMLGSRVHEERTARWLYLITGVLVCLLVYLAFALTKSTYVIGSDGIMKSTSLFF